MKRLRETVTTDSSNNGEGAVKKDNKWLLELLQEVT